jgi:hypothetical protein
LKKRFLHTLCSPASHFAAAWANQSLKICMNWLDFETILACRPNRPLAGLGSSGIALMPGRYDSGRKPGKT